MLQNPTWGNFFNSNALANLFSSFIDLHAGALKDTPAGCSMSIVASCTNEIGTPTYVQSRVSGVHIYSDHAVLELNAKPPQIAAVRKGTEWIAWGALPSQSQIPQPPRHTPQAPPQLVSKPSHDRPPHLGQHPPVSQPPRIAIREKVWN